MRERVARLDGRSQTRLSRPRMAVFSQNPEMIYQAFLKALKKGNVYAFKVLVDRAYGKVTETREVTHW